MTFALNETQHGSLDYITVVAFAALPTLIGLQSYAAWLCYGLAAIHLTMTVLTRMRLGLIGLIPMKLHALVELVVGPSLILIGLFGAPILGPKAWIFIPAGLVILLVWMLSDYRNMGETAA